jgi:hypothetical protein
MQCQIETRGQERATNLAISKTSYHKSKYKLY